MIKYLLFIGLTLTCLTSRGQVIDGTFKNDGSNIYNQAIIQLINYLETDSFKLTNSIYIEQDSALTEHLLTKMGNKQLIVIKSSDLADSLTKMNHGVRFFKLFPVEHKNKKSYISIIPYGVDYNNIDGNIKIVEPGFYRLIFTYRHGRFKFKRIEDHGI